MENTITLSNEFLQEKVKKDYSDHQIALVREFLQNSNDANSTEIKFDFNEDQRTLTVTDDGYGMDEDIMVNALFDIGGSYKENKNSTGGFGSAKLILLFQHEKYEIKTWRNNKRYEVHGQASTYSNIESFDDSDGVGTQITIHFLPNWAVSNDYDSFSSFSYNATSFLKQCDIKPIIKWNDEVMESYENGDVVKVLDWCEVRSLEKDSTEFYISVRINGIMMFQVYTGEMKRKIAVELTQQSLEILTTNRDGLRGGYGEELESLVKEININSNGFGSLNGKKFVYEGKDSSFFEVCKSALISYKTKIVDMLKVKQKKAISLNDQANISLLDRQITEFSSYVEKMSETETIVKMATDATNNSLESNEALSSYVLSLRNHNASKFSDESLEKKSMEIAQKVVSECETLTSSTNYDFIIEVDENIKKIPAKYNPQIGMNQKYTKLAKLWKRSINVILNHKKIDMKYKIGWHLNDKLRASCEGNDGVFNLLINPNSKHWFDGINKSQNIKRIFRTACHEITHALGHQWHDENFLLTCDNIKEVEDTISNWKKFEQDAYTEII